MWYSTVYVELLKVAVLRGDVNRVQLLASLGADVNQESDGIVPLAYAANNADLAMCLCLMELGAVMDSGPLSSREHWTPLHSAVDAHMEKAVSTLLALGADPNVIITKDIISPKGQIVLCVGSSLLHLIVMKRNLKIINILVAAGVSLASSDIKGNTALHVACKQASGEIHVVQKLLDIHRKSSTIDVLQSDIVNCQNDVGQTPLMVATAVREVDVVRILLLAGASVDICDVLKKLPLHAAVEEDSEELTITLLQAGCSVDGGAPSNYPHSPLHLAITENNWTLIDILLEYGADANLRTSSH